MTKDWFHGVGHSPVCQILLQIVMRAVITLRKENWLLLHNHTFLVDWAQQPWLAASLGEGQLLFETHECQVCWTGLTSDQGSGPVLWTYTGRKTLPPSKSIPLKVKIAGVNTAPLGEYLHSTKTRARLAEGFHDERNGHVFDLERDGLRQVVLCPRLTMR